MKILEFLFLVSIIFSIVQTQQNNTPTNLYQLLQITNQANSDEIKKAFRKLSVKYHPDRNAGDQTLHKKFLQIKRAYEVLIDVSKRNTYDLYGQEGLEEIQKRPKPKGGDFRTEMSLPLSMFYTGGQTVYSFRRGEICKHCKGTGDVTGHLHTCSVCGGTGKMTRQVKVKDTVKQVQMKCKQCGGSGHAGKSKCPVCNGQKIVLKPRDLKYEVQKGMRQGDKILFKGESQQGFQFYPGDVYLTLKQHPHSLFKRQKNDLVYNLDVSLKQAILGFEKNIKHLDGHAVQISGDYNVQDGQQMRIKGQGMPIRGQLDSFGDLIARINVKFPKKYSEDMLEDLKAIFDAGRQGNDEL